MLCTGLAAASGNHCCSSQSQGAVPYPSSTYASAYTPPTNTSQYQPPPNTSQYQIHHNILILQLHHYLMNLKTHHLMKQQLLLPMVHVLIHLKQILFCSLRSYILFLYIAASIYPTVYLYIIILTTSV